MAHSSGIDILTLSNEIINQFVFDEAFNLFFGSRCTSEFCNSYIINNEFDKPLDVMKFIVVSEPIVLNEVNASQVSGELTNASQSWHANEYLPILDDIDQILD